MFAQYLPNVDQRQLVLITGARQTGKTTLVKQKYSALPYYNLDAIEYRKQLGDISTFKWDDEIGASVIDEVQKEPALFDKIKFSFDEDSLNFSVLTGFSQVLLLKKVRETLAGRVVFHELFPFMMAEFVNPAGEKQTPFLLSQLLSGDDVDDTLDGINTPGCCMGFSKTS